MERVAQGGTVTLTAEFQTGAGDLTDPTDPTVDVIDAEDVEIVTDDEPTRLSLGRYSYTYVVPADAPLGVWRIHWGGTVDGLTAGADDWFDVVTPAAILTSAYDLLTLDEAKQALNIPLADTTLDDELAMYVTAISQRLDDECGPIVKRSVTETHDGGSSTIFLREFPVGGIGSVTEYRSGTEADLTAETSAVSTADDWVLDGDAGVLWRRSNRNDARFYIGRGTVSVTYTAGRFASTAAVSPKFKQAAAKMLAWLWKGDQGLGSATFGGGEETSLFGLGFALPNVVREMLAGEKRPPVIA